jgi:hypothetical protein
MLDKTFKAKSFTHDELVKLQEVAQKYILTMIRE